MAKMIYKEQWCTSCESNISNSATTLSSSEHSLPNTFYIH